jgi:glycosyltransferase involved in cell wall biosynthesis
VTHRIAHVISTRGVGGGERILSAVVAEAAGRGHEQLVLNPFANEGSEMFAALCGPARYEARGAYRVVHVPGVRRWIEQELRAFRPDIVHVMLFHALLVTSTIPKGEGELRILTQLYDGSLQLGSHSWVRERLEHWAARRFDRIVAISDSVKQVLVNDYRYPESKVARISPGWFGQPVVPRPDAAPTIVCVAMFRREKGHSILLSAFERVRLEVPDARLLLVGDGPLAPQIRAEVAARGMEASVEFLGSVADVWPVLARAHVFVLPSLSEAFGIAMVEAMAAGLPVVASAVGGLPELVRPGVSAELCPPGDHRALAEHLVRLLRSPELRERMGAAAREDAAPHRMQRTGERYLQLFEDLLLEREQALK